MAALPILCNPQWRIELSELEVQHVLHRGSGSTVLRAYWGARGRHVVLKSLADLRTLHGISSDASSLAAFNREVELTASIHHPNVISFEGLTALAPHAYMVLEYMPRGSLWDLLYGPLAPGSAINAARGLGKAAPGCLATRPIAPGAWESLPKGN